MMATTIEQSRYLLELGLDPNTADCNWNTTFGDWSLCIGKNKLPHAVPAWSLSALLEVIKKNSPELVCNEDKWYCGTTEYDTEYYPNKLDAVYEMVCWILKTRTD